MNLMQADEHTKKNFISYTLRHFFIIVVQFKCFRLIYFPTWVSRICHCCMVCPRREDTKICQNIYHSNRDRFMRAQQRFLLRDKGCSSTLISKAVYFIPVLFNMLYKMYDNSEGGYTCQAIEHVYRCKRIIIVHFQVRFC